jgi:hypothetical protein
LLSISRAANAEYSFGSSSKNTSVLSTLYASEQAAHSPVLVTRVSLIFFTTEIPALSWEVVPFVDYSVSNHGRYGVKILSMAQIVMVVTSIDSLAAYKVSDDLILELVGVTATVDDDSEGASVGTWWVQVVEPHELAKHQPPGGYMLDNRQVQMTCAKNSGISLGDRIKLRIVS